MNINPYYTDLQDQYLFSQVRQKVTEYKTQNPQAEVISLGIGDVTRPLAPAVVQAMERAVAEMGREDTFRGYGDEQGYFFLREAIRGFYNKKGVALEDEEIFISDGIKSDLGNILDIFSQDNTVLIPDPVYPVYTDTNIMAGRRILYTDGNIENGFLPMPDANVKADIIYLCSPNNPTGAVYNHAQLTEWVTYTLNNDAVLLFDAAYEAFAREEHLPNSIYKIKGATTCAIEFYSFSKTAGFTGTRCGYTVVPRTLVRQGAELNMMWRRRQTTKFNGVPYIVQRGAEAVFTEEGMAQNAVNIDYYRENAQVITDTLTSLNCWYTGGLNAPYIWLKCPGGMSSWAFFDYLLEKAHVVGTPGAGFGTNGEGFFRLTAFGNKENTKRAMESLRTVWP